MDHSLVERFCLYGTNQSEYPMVVSLDFLFMIEKYNHADSARVYPFAAPSRPTFAVIADAQI